MSMSVTPESNSELFQPLRKKSRRKWLYGGAAVIVVLGVGIPLVMKHLRGGSPISATQLYTVGYGSVTQTVSTSGTIQAPTALNLDFQGSANLNALITAVDVKVGQKVKAGQVLAKLDDSTEKISVEQAQASLKQANAGLAAAQARLAQDEQGVTSAQLAADKLAVTKAQTALSQAQQQYQYQLAAYNDRSSAQATVQSAQNALAQAQLALQSTNDTVAKDQQNLQNDESALQTAQQTLQNDIATYGNVTQAQVQAAAQTYQTQVGYYDSWINGGYGGANPYSTSMSNAKAVYDNLSTAYNTIQSDQQTITKDQQTIAADKLTLQTDEANQTQTQQKDELAVQAAQQNLQQAEANYNNRTSAQQSLSQAQNAVTNAQEALQSAQLTLHNDEQPSSNATIMSDEASVASAQASVQNAQANLQSAQLAEQETVLTAPISGVITQVNATVGQKPGSTTSATGTTSSSGGVIVMEDLNAKDLEVNLQVSESQIASVQPGDTVAITVPAYPNQNFSGTITQVYPVPQVSSNVTQYTVIATVNDSSGELKPGMTASAIITTAQKTHVLTVPAIALHQLGSREGVYVEGSASSSGSGFAGNAGGGNITQGSASGGSGFAGSGTKGSGSNGGGAGSRASGGSGGSRAGGGFAASGSKKNALIPAGSHFQPVQVGLMGSNTVEITGGLQAGDKILIVLPESVAAAQAQATSTFGGRGGFGFGGGFARGGGGGAAGGGGKG